METKQESICDAPTFFPTSEQWEDPLAYIATVLRPQAESQAGIAKIVPPKGWSPPFAINKESFKFPAKLQAVHHLQSKDSKGAIKQFWDDYNSFLSSIGSRHRKNPTYLSQEIDLYRLYKLVSRRGGYQPATDEKGWRDIANSLELADKSGNVAYTLRNLYQKHLLGYENHCRSRSEGGFKTLAGGVADKSKPNSEDVDVDNDVLDDAEAAEILEAMLGLGPVAEPVEPAKKKRRAPTQQDASIKVPENIYTMVCEKCNGGHYEDKIILCDRCDKGWHLFCLSPPLENVPEGEWVCPSCIEAEYDDFSNQEGQEYTFAEFKNAANKFEQRWFGDANKAKAASAAQKEEEYWKVIDSGEESVEVLYGANLDTTKVGSGFPRPSLDNTTEEYSAYASHPWNLNNLPRLSGDHPSLLRCIDGNLPGVTVPQLQMGMMFSSSCWRVSDHQWYNISYSHWGASVKWYGVPGFASGMFEGAYAKAIPDQAAQADLMIRPVCMLSPHVLKQHGVAVYALSQEAGEFVITFPNAYHSTIYLGLNCSESVNVAPSDWLRFGAMSVSRYRHFRKPSVISHERLMVTVAGAGDNSPRSSYWVSQEMRRVLEEETLMRAKLWSEGLVHSREATTSVGMKEGDKRDAECAICRLKLYLSAVECDCCPSRRTCLHHAGNLCECPMLSRRLVWRHTVQDLEGMQRAVAAAMTPEATVQVENEEMELNQVQTAAMEAAEAEALESSKKAPTNGKSTSGAGDAGELELLQDFASAAADGEGTEAAAGTSTRKRKRDNEASASAADDTGDISPVSLTLVSANGYVQGPVKPFAVLDVYPEDQTTVPEWLTALNNGCQQWRERARAALEGDVVISDIAAILEESEQYSWGGAGPSEAAAIAELTPRLLAANNYLLSVSAAIKGKPTLEELDEILAQDPPPVQAPAGLDKLWEASQAGREWLARAAEQVPDKGAIVDYKALETIVNEASRLPVTLPEAKVLRDRLSTARKLADTIRNALPTAREAGRRKKDDGQLSPDHLRQLKMQAQAIRVDMIEYTNLSTALERLDVWQSRVKALTGMRAPLTELQELVEESEGLPAAVPELEHVKGLIEKGESWLHNMASLMSTRAPLKKMRDLLHAGLRLPVEMPEVEELRIDIRKREWEEAARKAVNTKNTLHALTEALATAADMGATETALAASLRAKVEAAEAWQERAIEFFTRIDQPAVKDTDRPSLEELHNLVVEGFNTGVKVDRLQQLNTQLLAAKKWRTKAIGILEPLETNANAKLGSKAVDSGAAAVEKPAKSASVPVTSAAASGHPSGTRIDGDSDTGGQEIDGDGDQQMRDDEPADEEEGAVAALAAVAAAAAATEADEEDGNDQEGTAAAGASGVGLSGSEPMDIEAQTTTTTNLDTNPQEASKSVGRPRKGKKGGSQPSAPAPPPQPHLTVINTMLEEYEKSILVFLPQAEGLRKLRAGADVWLVEAQPVLEQSFVMDEQLPLLNELIAKGKKVGLAMEELEILEANVEALLWGQQVRALLEKLPALPKPETNKEEGGLEKTEDDGDKIEEQTSKDKKPEAGTAATAAAAAAGTSVGESIAPDVDMKQEDQEDHETKAVASKDKLQEDEPIPSQVKAGAASKEEEEPEEEEDKEEVDTNLLPYEERPLHSHLLKLLEEGVILPCDETTFERLQQHVNVVKDFAAAAEAVLAKNKDGVPLHLITVKQLRSLIARGHRLGQQITLLDQLAELLKSHEAWEQHIKQLMAAAGPRPRLSELLTFQQTSATSPVTSALRQHIDSTIVQADEWVERCRRSLAKRNTNMQLERCLDIVMYSVDCAVEQFERRLEVEKRLVASGSAPQTRPDIAAQEEDERELYCLCQQPYNVDTAMISCDGCSEWYHLRCVGVSQTQARSLRKYSCPICAAIRGNLDPLDAALHKLRRTKRPERGELGDLLSEIKALPVTIDEEVHLERVITKYDRWATATNRAIEVHEASRLTETGGQILPLSEGMLHQLCKSALAMEMDGTEHAEKILRLLRCNRWRSKGESLLLSQAGNNNNNNNKPNFEALQKLLQDAERHGIVPETDIGGSKLIAAAETTKKWQEAVKECITELKASGGSKEAFAAGVKKAQELMKEADALPLRVDRDIDSLQECSKLYCLCKKPYDEQRPMMGCDHCSDWFHYECVGLRPPGTGPPEEADVEENFRCPLCCMKQGTKYQNFHRLPQASIDRLSELAKNVELPTGGTTGAAAGGGGTTKGGPSGQVPPGTAAAAAQAAAMAMGAFPPGAWAFPGMHQPGMHPVPMHAMLPGMVPPEALQNWMQMFPGMMPGMGMFGFPGIPPHMAAAAAAAAAAQKNAQQQQQIKLQAAAAKAQVQAAEAKNQEEERKQVEEGSSQEGTGADDKAAAGGEEGSKEEEAPGEGGDLQEAAK